MMIHIGIRPEYELVQYDKSLWYEQMPDGKRRLWNKRMLKSGCNNLITTIVELEGLIYCPHCEEYFNVEQFIEADVD